ncbi:alpha/beta hydrolase [Carboxylicivirga sp. A043]|uniref:alpha/beta hydrolase n=1 Tax=Carboxylicivirga litoralis TaxID=2816963 RepID=UPI0021CB749D|nr:alpha/beta hydrolase [Carboxylicivirga sp. A043]MCU4154382.1 alpha/beta hydrolase [Carboxylicivirga sp. A043]
MLRMLFILTFLIACFAEVTSSETLYFVASGDDIDSNLLLNKEAIKENNSNSIFQLVNTEDTVMYKSVSVGDIQNDKEAQGRNFLFYVHGYGKELDDVIKRSLQIQRSYGVRVIFFYWPYRNSKGKQTNLRQAKNIIRQHQQQFAFFLSLRGEFAKKNPDAKVSLMAHSLGNQFLKDYAFYLQGNNEVRPFDNIILNSAAVNDKNHAEWLSKLSIQNNIYIISNRHDFLLRGLRLFTHSKRPLGVRVKSERLGAVNYIDMSEIIGRQKPRYNSHSFFTGDMPDSKDEVFTMYQQLLNGFDYRVKKSNVSTHH